MTETFCQTAELAGMEFDFTGEFEFHYEDNSFSHEFGIERCGQYEVDQIDWADFDCDERAICADYLRDECRNLSRKRFRKVLRQRVRMVHAALANADLDNLFDISDLEEIASEAGDNYNDEPDYEPDYE